LAFDDISFLFGERKTGEDASKTAKVPESGREATAERNRCA
jgi:hypothetical protein